MASNAARPTVEELILKAEAMKLDSDGVRHAFEHPSAPKFADQTSSWLPDSDSVHAKLLDSLASFLGDEGRVLDLGAGTGRLTRLVLDRYLNCSVVAADYSTAMRSVAAEQLERYGARVELVDLDMFSTSWPSEFTGFDVVVSGFAIHHGRNSDDYRLLYERIGDALRSGGLFINLDHVEGEDRKQTIANAEGWRDFLDESGFVESDKFILGSYAEDTPIAMSEHIRLLEDVGFGEVENLWQKMIFGLYRAVKAG
jgi:tRNA (cmo5U34)-methyltransferase